VARRGLSDLLGSDGKTVLTCQKCDANPVFGGNARAAPMAYASMIDTERGTDFAVGPDLFKDGPVREARAHAGR
jgi:hypothetical protein